MKNTRDEILEIFFRKLKKVATDIEDDNFHVPAPWESIEDANGLKKELKPLAPVAPLLYQNQTQEINPIIPKYKEKDSNVEITEKSPMETVSQEPLEVFFPEEQKQHPISKRDDIASISEKYYLSNPENAKRIRTYKNIIENTNAIYKKLDFEDLFSEEADNTDPFNENPEYQAKYNTKHFLTSVKSSYRGMRRDPAIAELVDRVINYYIANDPESLFKWNVFRLHGGFDLREKYYGPAVISYLDKNPMGLFQNRVFNDAEFIRLGLLPKLWTNIIGLAKQSNVGRFSGESEAALLMLHKGLFEYNPEFYKNIIMDKDKDGNPKINVSYFSNPNRINAEKRRQKTIIRSEQEKGV